MYPDVIPFDKLNLSQFDWLEIEELEMQLIDFQSSSIWIQKIIETRKKLELIEVERLTSNISKNTSNEILETWNSIPDASNYLQKLAKNGTLTQKGSPLLVYADKPQTLDHLEDNTRHVIADIRPQMLEKAIENWTSRLESIRASRSSPMPEIIFKM
ncbi:dimer_Tnp_hAT domain-containing protein [Trichonephila clavipes]|uniref:Dimer_Tnp_hAT domain-containing protein n=1 Tax=Trichonephila clavipes TaxID=2585209 RepID=A0A8X6REU2_TRICX|nr:dimer_Tnp_hAT domain-containing protein [Trichonephila clavipes]